MRHPDPRTTRRGARSVGVAASALWLVPLLGSVIAGEGVESGELAETIGVVLLAALNVAGVAIAFGRERPGGWFLIATGSAFSLFALASAGRNHALAMLVSGGPFVVSGLLFLAAARQLCADPPPRYDSRSRRSSSAG